MKDQNLLSFEICVANRYKLNKKARELQSRIDERPDDYTLRSRFHQAQLAAKAETEDNDLEQKRQQGKKLLYGQVIQLKHRFTLKYIHVSTSATSPTEGKNMAVVLHPYNAKHAQFKIMPRYKVKAEGDVVQEGDQLVFESVKSRGQYLHVSKTLFGGQSVYQKSYELNLSVQQSGFAIYRKYRASPEDEKKVKIGNMVRFYHKEMEAYLVAEGLFDYDITEDVHLRCRPVEPSNPKSMLPSSSAITFWQIELQEGCVAGGILHFEQQCKLLHMCTRKYLCVETNKQSNVEGKYKVNLTSDHLDPKSVFRLHPVNKDSDDIPEGSHCRIEHVVSGQWLHASTAEYIRNQVKALNKESRSLGSLKWSTAHMRKITVADEQQYDDAFTIQTVDPALENIFSFMAGMVPFLQKLLQDKKDDVQFDKEMSLDATTALTEMCEFMMVDREPIKQRQKLMRNLRIVELLVNLLKCPLTAHNHYYMSGIFRVVYKVLHTYLLGRSRKNKLYIARYIDFFRTQFEIKEGDAGLNAVHVVMESLRDNRKIVDLITEDHINKFVELLLLEKNYRYLDLLSVLCVCAGVSISINQNLITNSWLITNRLKCVFQTKLEKTSGSDRKVYVSTNNGQSWIDLVTFSGRNRESEEYLFFESQLKLFGYLARGQNDIAISVITKDYLTWKELFACLSDEQLPEQLRAMCCDLIITLFVDIAGNRSVLDRVKLCYVFDEIKNDEESEVLVQNTDSETYKHFPKLSRWIADFLSKNTEMTASNIGNNILIKQVLRLVYCLVSFGFYRKRGDIKKLLGPLMLLLDGRHDKPYPNVEGKETQEILVVFRQSQRFKPSPETKAIVEAKVQALEVLDLFFNFRFNNRLEKFIYLFKTIHRQINKPKGFSELAPLMNESFELEQFAGLAKKAKKKMADIFDSTAFMRQFNLVDILLDLSQYEYDDIVRKSMHLLNRWFSAYQNLFKRAVLTQILITDESVEVYKRTELLMPELRRLAAYRMGEIEADHVITILTELLSFCHLPGEEEEPHPTNQNILYNCGIIECMFIFLSKEIDVKILDHYVDLRRVFEISFVLLKMLARSNQVIQHRLYDRLDLILSKRGGFVQMAELVTEIFTENTQTCMKVTEHQIQKIMSLITTHRKAVPQFVGILKAVIKADDLDLPIKRNQSMVMTNFMQHSSDVAPAIDKGERSRLALFESSDTHELHIFISVVDLLATCAEGENKFIESICQTIFKIPELFKVLNNPNISDNLKRPYLTFFLGSYLNTVNRMIGSGAGDIHHDTATWEYVTNVNETIVKVTVYVNSNRDQVGKLLKKPPGNGITDRNEMEQMRGSLHYLFSAVMPFLQVFCTSYYENDQVNYPAEVVKMKALSESFKSFFEEIVPLVSNEKQLEKLITCMSILFSTNTLASVDMDTFQQKYGQGIGAHDVRSDARKKYEECFGGEEEISAQLSVFANNMKVAYGGFNDVQAQIGFPSRRRYSEVGGDEELPLSEEFQAHINIFIDHSARTPLEKYRLSEKLIRQLSISTKLMKLPEREMIEQLELDLKCMQLLRGMVHNELVKLPEHIEYNSSSWKKQLKVIQDVQNALNHYGSIAGTLGHLARTNDDVVRELLAFLVALLFNGNFAVQTTLYEFFSFAKEETFVLAIQNRINLSIIATRERRVLQALRQTKIEETPAQAKALKKAMKNGSLADLAVSSLSRTLRQSMASVRKSVTILPSSHGSRRHSKAREIGKMKQGSVVGSGIIPDLQVESHASNGTIYTQASSDLTLKGRHPEAWGPSRTTFNKVAPDTKHFNQIVLSIDHEVAVQEISVKGAAKEIKGEDDELENLLNAEMPEFNYKDDGCIELVLRILGSMCDNQHTGLQNYIREQSNNIKSIDLVAETINFLKIMYTNISADTIVLVTEIFETLVEFTSGNSTNQAVVFDNKICDYINHILRADVFKDCTDKEVYTLKRAIGFLVRCLTVENFSVEDGLKASLPKEVMEFLDTTVLVSVMTDARKLYEPMKEEDFKALLHTVGFQYYHLLAMKLDLFPELDMDSILKTEEQKAAFSFYSDNTLSIEIVKDDIIQKVYFQVRDKGVLREEIKERFKYEVDRSSPSNKLRDFMEWVRDIIKDIKYQRRVRANPVGRFFVNAWLPLNYLVMLCTLIICVVVMVTWEEGDGTSPRYNPSFRFANANVVIYILGGVHNCLSIGICISYIISNRPTFPSVEDIKEWWTGIEDNDDEGENWIDAKKESHLEVKAFELKTIYYLLFVACSIAGTFTDGYFFAFHLLHIAELNHVLKGVIRAVTTNGKALLMVTLLALAIFYIYSLVIFAFYRGWMWSAEDGRHCRTIYECFISVLHHGLVDGLYSHFERQMGSDFPQAIGITFIDVSFFVIITIIGLNIVLGIIVDTFSQLRDSKFEIDKDMRSTYLICSRESYDFEKKGGGEGFQRHVKLEHNQWAYLFFFIHLDETRPNDYSAIELHVYQLMMMKSLDFFPLGRALSLENEEDSKDKKLDELQLQVNFVVAKLKEQEVYMMKEKEKQKQQEWARTHKA
ncbi:inositol 1,4,5-trisphosphate receptor type 3-like isoform X2 [Mercenaria mercenaria]|nr:inositol 1,4,5-trisphosphate receptor type 3-like isoform X2 [Mercenaria mercenaria]